MKTQTIVIILTILALLPNSLATEYTICSTGCDFNQTELCTALLNVTGTDITNTTSDNLRIEEAGTYHACNYPYTYNITTSTNGFLKINASNVTIDLMGGTLRLKSSYNINVIQIYLPAGATNGHDNITIRNGTFIDWFRAIYTDCGSGAAARVGTKHTFHNLNGECWDGGCGQFILGEVNYCDDQTIYNINLDMNNSSGNAFTSLTNTTIYNINISNTEEHTFSDIRKFNITNIIMDKVKSIGLFRNDYRAGGTPENNYLSNVTVTNMKSGGTLIIDAQAANTTYEYIDINFVNDSFIRISEENVTIQNNIIRERGTELQIATDGFFANTTNLTYNGTIYNLYVYSNAVFSSKVVSTDNTNIPQANGIINFNLYLMNGTSEGNLILYIENTVSCAIVQGLIGGTCDYTETNALTANGATNSYTVNTDWIANNITLNNPTTNEYPFLNYIDNPNTNKIDYYILQPNTNTIFRNNYIGNYDDTTLGITYTSYTISNTGNAYVYNNTLHSGNYSTAQNYCNSTTGNFYPETDTPTTGDCGQTNITSPTPNEQWINTQDQITLYYNTQDTDNNITRLITYYLYYKFATDTTYTLLTTTTNTQYTWNYSNIPTSDVNTTIDLLIRPHNTEEYGTNNTRTFTIWKTPNAHDNTALAAIIGYIFVLYIIYPKNRLIGNILFITISLGTLVINNIHPIIPVILIMTSIINFIYDITYIAQKAKSLNSM